MEQFEEEICCILNICCGGANNRDAKAALAKKLVASAGLQADQAATVSAYIMETFDLAPSGSLKAYRDAVAKMAREYPYQDEDA